MSKNEWESYSNGERLAGVLDELTEVQKAQIMNYVYVAVEGYVKNDRAILTQLQQDNTMLKNALNVLLGCLETGIPVKNGKVSLCSEDMQVLAAPKALN